MFHIRFAEKSQKFRTSPFTNQDTREAAGTTMVPKKGLMGGHSGVKYLSE